MSLALIFLTFIGFTSTTRSRNYEKENDHDFKKSLRGVAQEFSGETISFFINESESEIIMADGSQQALAEGFGWPSAERNSVMLLSNSGMAVPMKRIHPVNFNSLEVIQPCN